MKQICTWFMCDLHYQTVLSSLSSKVLWIIPAQLSQSAPSLEVSPSLELPAAAG